MWDHTRSASRTNISTRGLYVFTHTSALGNTPAASLLDMIKTARATEGAPRAWTDYHVSVPDLSALPAGISIDGLC